MTGHSTTRESLQTGLDRISLRAQAQPDTVFNNLGHAITEALLLASFQELSAEKAAGIDKVTKDSYEQDLSRNLSHLLTTIRKGTYRSKPARIVEISKEDGSTRPLAISCLEDKIVQGAVASILEAIVEPTFLPCSYGFRPNRNCHDALRVLMKTSYAFRDGAIIEIDIRQYFNRIPHGFLLEILKEKITDSRFLRLIERLITAPILEDGVAVPNSKGCPQGSILSPILANIYLHHVIDRWFTEVKRTHMRGRAELIRYCDDMVFIFECREDAAKLWRVLGKRLNKYGLEIHADKSRLLTSGSLAAKRGEEAGKRMETYQFLGFTCYWGKARKGFWRLKFTSRSDRFTRALQGIRNHLREELVTPEIEKTLKGVVRRVKGWMNYHAISDNQRRVNSFLYQVRRAIQRWFNRKGSKRSLQWEDLPHWLSRIGFPSTYKVNPMW